MRTHSKPVQLTLPASMLRSEPFLELLSEALFCPYCSWRLAPDDPSRWPLQGYKLRETKLYHEQIMEHGTFAEKSNTHSHPEYKHTETKA